MTHVTPKPRLITLVLAGSRSKGDDPLAAYSNDHKAFIDIGGVPMIEHVINALASVDAIEDIWISAPEDIRTRFESIQHTAHSLKFTNACDSPAATIESAIRAAPNGAELLVTTCDHALLTPEMVYYFLSKIDRDTNDAAAACVLQETFTATYPNAKRTFVRLRDFTFSGANLFWFKKDASEPLIEFWRRLEDKRKKPAKMAAEIGLTIGALYLAGMLSKERILSKIKERTNVKVALTPLPFANAAIDVDKPQDIDLVRSII